MDHLAITSLFKYNRNNLISFFLFTSKPKLTFIQKFRYPNKGFDFQSLRQSAKVGVSPNTPAAALSKLTRNEGKYAVFDTSEIRC